MGDPHDRTEQMLPPPCCGCGERLGVYEPIVIHETTEPTSWTRLRPEQRRTGLRAWHPGCLPDD
jgi:hypothetical protein